VNENEFDFSLVLTQSCHMTSEKFDIIRRQAVWTTFMTLLW